MLNRLILWSLHHRAWVILTTVLLLGLGFRASQVLPVEVLPDLTKPTVVILTESPGLAPEEVEMRVTQPLEAALSGISGVSRLRSNSDVALSLVYVEFDWGTDIYRARTLVQERLQSAQEQLPTGTQPFITPVASLMGEILLVGVRCQLPKQHPHALQASEVRTLADWTIKRRLLRIPGIAEVLNMGGGIRQIEILPDPHRLQALGVSWEEVEAAAKSAALTRSAGFLQSGTTEMSLRGLAMTTNLEALGQTPVKSIDQRHITLKEVADIQWGIEPMRGDATLSAAPEKEPTYGVILSVTKAAGSDTRQLTEQIQLALAELAPSLPEGVETRLLFQQKDFIDHAIGNLSEAIRDGAIMVTVVLLLFLMNFRTSFITLMAIPVSFSLTLLTFQLAGMSVNSMTLGGLAVAIGMVVDDAIVDVENVFRRLNENAALAQPKPRLQVIAEASAEVRHSILYATLLIVLVFVPLLGLQGVEGKLFAPIAIATITSMIASFLVSLSLIPVLCSLILRPKSGKIHRSGPLIRSAQWLLDHTLLKLALARPHFVLASALLLLIATLSLYPRMSQNFMPKFQEETALVSINSAPGTSLKEMNRLADAAERQILSIPEVRQVGRRLGRAERGDHVVPVSTAEFDVDFQEAEAGNGRSRREILDEIGRKVREVPGIYAVVTGPLTDRIGHLMSGVSAPIAVKVFGPNLDELKRIGTEVQSLAKTIPGLEQAKLDVIASIPQWRIEPKDQRPQAYGISPAQMVDHVSRALAGEVVAELRDQERSIHLVLRLPQAWRDSPEQIAQLPIQVSPTQFLPLDQLANIRPARGPNVIFRENGQRRFTIAIQPNGKDVAALAAQLQREIREKIQLPATYSIQVEGEFQAQAAATWRIALGFLAVLCLVCLLLFQHFQSISLSLQVLANLPLALIGGLALTAALLNHLSVASLVGFIAVGGIAARNGIMMISHYLHLIRHEGEVFGIDLIRRGTLERLVPVLMTALAAGVALVPLLFAADQPGKEIIYPVAVIIVGGLISSTFLDMAVTPAMFLLFGRKAAQRAAQTASASPFGSPESES